jgi:hypothetical protein
MLRFCPTSGNVGEARDVALCGVEHFDDGRGIVGVHPRNFAATAICALLI